MNDLSSNNKSNALPFNAYALIFQYLTIEETISTRRVSKSWKVALDYDNIWYNFIERDFPNYEIQFSRLLQKSRFIHKFGDIFFNAGRSAYAFAALSCHHPAALCDFVLRFNLKERKRNRINIPRARDSGLVSYNSSGSSRSDNKNLFSDSSDFDDDEDDDDDSVFKNAQEQVHNNNNDNNGDSSFDGLPKRWRHNVVSQLDRCVASLYEIAHADLSLSRRQLIRLLTCHSMKKDYFKLHQRNNLEIAEKLVGPWRGKMRASTTIVKSKIKTSTTKTNKNKNNNNNNNASAAAAANNNNNKNKRNKQSDSDSDDESDDDNKKQNKNKNKKRSKRQNPILPFSSRTPLLPMVDLLYLFPYYHDPSLNFITQANIREGFLNSFFVSGGFQVDTVAIQIILLYFPIFFYYYQPISYFLSFFEGIFVISWIPYLFNVCYNYIMSYKFISESCTGLVSLVTLHSIALEDRQYPFMDEINRTGETVSFFSLPNTSYSSNSSSSSSKRTLSNALPSFLEPSVEFLFVLLLSLLCGIIYTLIVQKRLERKFQLPTPHPETYAVAKELFITIYFPVALTSIILGCISIFNSVINYIFSSNIVADYLLPQDGITLLPVSALMLFLFVCYCSYEETSKAVNHLIINQSKNNNQKENSTTTKELKPYQVGHSYISNEHEDFTTFRDFWMRDLYQEYHKYSNLTLRASTRFFHSERLSEISDGASTWRLLIPLQIFLTLFGVLLIMCNRNLFSSDLFPENEGSGIAAKVLSGIISLVTQPLRFVIVWLICCALTQIYVFQHFNGVDSLVNKKKKKTN